MHRKIAHQIICKQELPNPSNNTLLKLREFCVSTAEVESSGDHTSASIRNGSDFHWKLVTGRVRYVDDGFQTLKSDNDK